MSPKIIGMFSNTVARDRACLLCPSYSQVYWSVGWKDSVTLVSHLSCLRCPLYSRVY